jgi:hypothetical protein
MNETETQCIDELDDYMLDLYGLKPEAKRKRIIEDFGTFCSLVLAWEARQQVRRVSAHFLSYVMFVSE